MIGHFTERNCAKCRVIIGISLHGHHHAARPLESQFHCPATAGSSFANVSFDDSIIGAHLKGFAHLKLAAPTEFVAENAVQHHADARSPHCSELDIIELVASC